MEVKITSADWLQDTRGDAYIMIMRSVRRVKVALCARVCLGVFVCVPWGGFHMGCVLIKQNEDHDCSIFSNTSQS